MGTNYEATPLDVDERKSLAHLAGALFTSVVNEDLAAEPRACAVAMHDALVHLLRRCRALEMAGVSATDLRVAVLASAATEVLGHQAGRKAFAKQVGRPIDFIGHESYGRLEEALEGLDAAPATDTPTTHDPVTAHEDRLRGMPARGAGGDRPVGPAPSNHVRRHAA